MADGSSAHPTGRFTRRAFVAAPLALAAGLTGHATLTRAGQPTGTPGAECAAAPGVQLLVDLGRGLPVVNALDLAIPAGWTSFFDTQLGIAYYHPADWQVVRLWADRLTPAGAPAWTAQQPLAPIVASARAVSPAGNAAFETVVANLPGVAVTPTQAATLARIGVTGDGVPAEPICAFTAPFAFTYDWFDAAVAGGATIVTMGLIRTNPGPFTPSSVLVWYSLVSPEQEFEAHVRDVFVRILTALIPGREVVPTPTPD
jgi:hypothetical protein